MPSLLSSSSTFTLCCSLSKKFILSPEAITFFFTRKAVSYFGTKTTMSVNLQSHAFAGNPLRSKTPKSTDPLSPPLAFETLKTQLLGNTHQLSSLNFKVLPFRKGRPLASSSSTDGDLGPKWHMGLISLDDCKGLFSGSGVELSGDSMVYLGSRSEEDVVYWAIDVSGEDSLVTDFFSKQFCIVELRTLMVATDWADERPCLIWLLLVMPKHCWSGITSHVFVDIVERKLSPWNLGARNNAQMNCAEGKFILVWIQSSSC